MSNKKNLFLALLFILSGVISSVVADDGIDLYRERFMKLSNQIHRKSSGYLSKEGIPYHSKEKFIIEAVDYGHNSTSEVMGTLLWMDVLYGKITGKWKRFRADWDVIEKYFIPSLKEQPNIELYRPENPSSFSREYDDPNKYPVNIDFRENVGRDPLYSSLLEKYGRGIYLMHWYVDVDNWLKFQNKRAVKIKLFERGPEESTWETIPHPCYDEKGGGERGFVDLFIKSDAPQWRYTSAPDAELRIVQAMYWANEYSKEKNVNVSNYLRKTKKMGDFLRYSLYDKYFRKIGTADEAAKGKESAHYLISWIVAWGGAIEGNWSWRIGYNKIHAGYQNPMAAYYLSELGVEDWDVSTKRQMELISWIQSEEGPIGGGVDNDYAKQGGAFHGMHFNPHPVYRDPSSNAWAGWQYFLMERVAQYYYVSGDKVARQILSKWVAWLKKHVEFSSDGDVKIPVELSWSGAPETGDLSAKVKYIGHDVGGQALAAMILMFWDQANKKWGEEDVNTMYLARKILDNSWNTLYDGIGLAAPETKHDYFRYWNEPVMVPKEVEKKTPWKTTLSDTSKFRDSRPSYRGVLPPKGPYGKGNPAPVYRYHRTWAQCQFATALAYCHIFLQQN